MWIIPAISFKQGWMGDQTDEIILAMDKARNGESISGKDYLWLCNRAEKIWKKTCLLHDELKITKKQS